MFKYGRGHRKSKGAMSAEYVCTMYILFLFIFFPMLNLGTVGLRAFFLWFACNQATMLGAKAKTFNTLVYVPEVNGTAYPGAYDTARSQAMRIQNMFPGINWVVTATNPEVDILLSPIQGSGAGAAQTVVGPQPLGLGNIPDVNQYVSSIRVTITGSVAPLIPMPMFNIQGLTSPLTLKVSSQAEFENPPGLQF